MREGLLDEAALDAAVGRILTLKFELGLFEDPRHPTLERQTAVIGSAEHAELNLEVARRSLVLLTNDGTLAARADGRADRRSPSSAPTPTTSTPSSATGPAPPARPTGCPTATRAS